MNSQDEWIVAPEDLISGFRIALQAPTLKLGDQDRAESHRPVRRARQSSASPRSLRSSCLAGEDLTAENIAAVAVGELLRPGADGKQKLAWRHHFTELVKKELER